MLTLIHIDPRCGPVGVWRIVDGHPVGHYSDPARRPRAEAALANRGAQVPWDDWFGQLADRGPYLDDYETIASGLPLEAVLQLARDGWTTTK